MTDPSLLALVVSGLDEGGALVRAAPWLEMFNTSVSAPSEGARPVSFCVHGKPVGKQRPRTVRTRGGGVRTYTPKETVAFERAVALAGRGAGLRPVEGPVSVEVVAVYEPPTSWSERRKREAMGQPHQGRGDADNVLKSVCDALEGVAYPGDHRVWDQRATKIYGPQACTRVRVTQWEGD